MPIKGKEFEKRISIIESTELPDNAKISFLKCIIDKNTNVKREVDISIEIEV